MTKKKTLQGSIEVTRTSRQARTVVTCDLRIGSPETFGYFGVKGIDTAPALVRLAKVKGVSVVAVTDFYTTDFAYRVHGAAAGGSVVVLPGFSLRAALPDCDDVTLVAIFDENEKKQVLDKVLEELDIPAEASGDERYLCQQPFHKIIDCIESAGGVVFPSRMDQTPAKRVAIETLVEQYGFRSFDLAHDDSSTYFTSRWPKTDFALMQFSNARSLAQVGSRYSSLAMSEPSFEAIKTLFSRELSSTPLASMSNGDKQARAERVLQ